MINASDILKASILIVDDQRADVSLLERALRDAGFISIAFTMNPHEVCELHRKNGYDLILLDLRMPDMDGFQVMEGLKAIETEGYLSVLVFTAHPAHKLRALKAGAKDFVSKPLDLAEVLLRVHNLLEVRLLHKESSLRTEQAETRTEQVETRSAQVIRASELRYRRLFETAKEGLMILDAGNGRIRDVNPFLTELLGLSHNEMVGKTVSELSPFNKRVEAQVLALNAELEQRVIRRTSQLQAANEELESFSYAVSHDLRAPLRRIAGFSRILVNEFGPAMAVEAREHLRLIEDAVHRMGMMVDALLKMAILRHQSLQLHHSELNPIVDEVISMLQPECDGRDVKWRIEKLPALDCDPILMAQVFQNLLGNALKYSRGRAKAVIEVGSITPPDKPPVIFVRDNGAGFNIQYAEKLFGVFQRFHTDSEFEGTGVGLATVHRIIQKHGGTIWAESEPDHGATFYFALQMTDQIGAIPKATAAS
jgi:signal transduction histidine kinase